MKFYLLIILAFLQSCIEIGHNLSSPQSIELGKVKSGDTVHFSVPIYNNSKTKDIKIKKISSECSCTIIYDQSQIVKKEDSIILDGLFLASKTEFGAKTNKIVINSTADNTFNVIEIKAFLEN